MATLPETKRVYSYCRGCCAYCGLEFEVEGNDIKSHRGNPEHVNSAGYKCIKADMSVEIIQGMESRFETSMRRGEGGVLQPVSSDVAMDEIAAKIRDSIEKYGPRSVALYIGTAGYRKSFNLSMAKQLMGRIGSPAIFSTMTIDQSAHWVLDGRLGIFATGRPTVEDVDLVVLSGTNPVISHGGPYQILPTVNQKPYLKAYRERGGKMLIIDPRKTETARIADLHLQPRPGYDTEIFAALIRLVIDQGGYDKAFSDRWVTNVDQLRQAVDPFTPEFVAERAGLEVAELHAAAQMIIAANRVSMSFGTGTSMSPNPNTAAHVIGALNAICGGFLREGDIRRNAGVYAERAMAEKVLPPNRTWLHEPKTGGGFGTVYGEFPSSQLAHEILTPGPTQIRTLIVLGANPMMAFGQPDKLREAFSSLDCLVVVEPRHTETTALADYVIAPPLQYEVKDINLLVAEWTYVPYIQYTEAVIQPPEGVIEEWKFFNGVANRLGITMDFSPYSFAGSADEASAVALTTDREWKTEDLIEITLNKVGTSIAEMRNHPNGLHRPRDVQTITGPDGDDGARLDACPPDVAEELAKIARYAVSKNRSYSLINRRITELMNSEFRDSGRLRKRFGGAAPLFMHPDDMAAEGFAQGSAVTLIGDHGKISGLVRPDSTLRRGVVSMPHNWNGLPDAAPASNHTSRLVSMAVPDVQPIDGMPHQSSLPVDLIAA